MLRNRILNLINRVIDYSINFVEKEENGECYYIDANDKKEISNHYGMTHLASALLIFGYQYRDAKSSEIGLDLLESVLNRWNTNKHLPGYHADFNNFAICTLWFFCKENNIECPFENEIKSLILNSDDSNNPTTNWLPMRCFVNICRYYWSNNELYLRQAERCIDDIYKVCYKDGFIDDRIPKGKSFNLQYDIATVAVLQYIMIHHLPNYKPRFNMMECSVGALINAVLPDGDINYFGRGTNQIFAWGLWVYLLSATSQEKALSDALSFLEKHTDEMLKTDNIMLNRWDGKEKYLWWDYHYSSVYTAHFLFWLVLSLIDFKSTSISYSVSDKRDSGFEIIKTQDAFVAIFEGRSEYLCETGPVISALWIKKYGTVFKGTFGPWKGHFGNKYTSEEATLRNYMGLIKVPQKHQIKIRNHYIGLKKILKSETIEPMLFKPHINVDKELVITFETFPKDTYVFNFPVFANSSLKKKHIKLFVDGNEVELNNDIIIRNQYSWVKLWQSRPMNGSRWEIIIE